MIDPKKVIKVPPVMIWEDNFKEGPKRNFPGWLILLICMIMLFIIGLILGIWWTKSFDSHAAEIDKLEISVKMHELKERQAKEYANKLNEDLGLYQKYTAKQRIKMMEDSTKSARKIANLSKMKPRPLTDPVIDSLLRARYNLPDTLLRKQLVQNDLEMKDTLESLVPALQTEIKDGKEQIAADKEILEKQNIRGDTLLSAVNHCDSARVDQKKASDIEIKDAKKKGGIIGFVGGVVAVVLTLIALK